ncbi:MAG: chemotaxis protein methyltransferase CheR [Campylobacterota bacterium]|nr:chemotaxis protein methyltransferase CheR [Campylobacterota bacterium]
MAEIELSDEEFLLFKNYIYKNIGISLSEQKKALVKGRLNKRILELNLTSFREYYRFLINDVSGEELSFFQSAVSTNVTSFFREEAQWRWLESNFLKYLSSKKEKKIRIWSAGCSSGEEPYTILMFLQSYLKDFDSWDIKILATDISSKVLRQAIDGVYDAKNVELLPKYTLQNSFEKINIQSGMKYKIKQHLKDKILFRLYNLVTDPLFFKNEFDIIFCRNVMIYFDEKTKKNVISKFTNLLPANSFLFIGSSESLISHKESLKLITSSIYQKF